MTQVTIRFSGQTLTATLFDNSTAQALVDHLPLTLTFRDFNGVEKIADLQWPLTTQGVPAGADPEVNDVGYYAPSGDLVFYYGDVDYWNGIVRLGSFDGDIAAIRSQPDVFKVLIERATDADEKNE
ncbi:cyclophilin-like fold protein [Pedococcus sp. 5OH_020]|uniref:cyclophilin-like fold protein n=1 Tax=Pedococcus sp. 5OH_020 TaxID=2989814 RepID=UPI0022E9F129|nr:cyclophilin-like fold protein [Pedococcus sp. 5OH_020]